eukprot:CAMPEP_0175444554 /NCGR_PEP_ID=MMETSP0095-20121207/59276_1 /TAXON_ID=311494 /ORGANISM="Alexandrium monilatum, Strain CCMP3105" /LENGTH=50 /DNA_ID=CAMNT_0016744723 /DNA_START=8 /DNA_END=156 /DNA_ORIENTATION=+
MVPRTPAPGTGAAALPGAAAERRGSVQLGDGQGQRSARPSQRDASALPWL